MELICYKLLTGFDEMPKSVQVRFMMTLKRIILNMDCVKTVSYAERDRFVSNSFGYVIAVCLSPHITYIVLH